MQNSSIVILPAILVIVLVLTTRRMILAFLLGIISSGFIAMDGNPLRALWLCAQRLFENSGIAGLRSIQAFRSNSSLLIFSFLILLGILIELLAVTGADQAYVKLTKNQVKSKKAAEGASLILSLFFFFDDYFSALTVGSVMRPLAYLHNVHPVKLAFLTTVMASPLVILSPLSSWVGQISLQLKTSGIGSHNAPIIGDSYFAYVSSIPFIFYSLSIIVCAWYIVLRSISYGPMQRYDQSHIKKEISDASLPRDSSFLDFLMPLILLIAGVFTMFLYTGGYFHGVDFTTAFKNASPNQAFFIGGLTSVILSSLYFLAKRTITMSILLDCIISAGKLMYPSIIMLTFVWTLGSMLAGDLKTGSYIAKMVSSFINLKLFPVICFLFAGCIASMIGSAWATMGLMFPIVIEMLQRLLQLPATTTVQAVPLLIPVIGATLSGCVFGTHLSLISDNPILSSASTGANHLEHVKTMAWYVIPVGMATALAYMVVGFAIAHLGLAKSMLVGIVTSISFSLLFIELAQLFFAKKRKR